MPMARRPEPAPEAGEPLAPRLRRRWLVNLALLAVITALAAFFFYHRQQEQAETGPPLTAISAQQVTRLQIERPGQSVIVLEKHGEDWRLVAPLKARANRFAVENALRVAAVRSELKLDGGEPAHYGLATPQAKLRFGDEVIEFGTLHPFRQQVYVRYHGAVHLIPAATLTAVARAPAHFIDGRLIEADRRIVEIRLPGFALALKDGSWQRQPPDKNLASDRINNFVAQWRNAQALAVESPSGRPVLAPIRLTLQRGNGKPETLALGVLAHKPEFVLWRPDEKLEYHFPEEIGKRLLTLETE